MKTAERPAGYRKYALPLAVVLSWLAVFIPSTPVMAAPVVILNPAYGAVGTQITITGTVFDSYKGDSIHIFFDSQEITGSPLTVPATGVFTIPFVIPDATAAGQHWIRIKSEVGSTSFLTENFLIVDPVALALDVQSGPAGTDIAISGSGFRVGRTVTLYYLNNTIEQIGTETASAIGRFTHHFTIPDGPGGLHRITAANDSGNTAATEFRVLASLKLTLAAAGPGELLKAIGRGFGSRSTVSISFGTVSVTSALADDYGNLEIEFNTPNVKPGPYDVRAQDEKGNLGRALFTVTAGISVSQSSGAVGSPLTVQGIGFKAGPVTVDFDKIRVGTAVADNNGAFTSTFNVPPAGGGPHVITISDGATTRRFDFIIESNAPPVPVLFLPANGTETMAQAFFDWSDITDPSLPVVYHLEVASDNKFASLILEKTGLTDSQYTLARPEILAVDSISANYFWRVKATDGAGNESAWTAPSSFYVNAPLPPVVLQPTSGTPPGTPVLFKWQPVTSLTPPVTYALEVSTDRNFDSPALEKTGLAATEFRLPGEDELKLRRGTTYYWRVRAVDGASNRSGWSAPGSFSLGSAFTFPSWAIYTLIGIGVIIIAFLAFRAGRNTAYGLPE